MNQEQTSHLVALKQGKISVPANHGSNGDEPVIIYGVEKKPSFATSPAKTYSVPLSDLEIFLGQDKDTGLDFHYINDETKARLERDGGLLIVSRGYPRNEPYGKAVFSKDEFKVIKEYVREFSQQPEQTQ